MSTHPQPIGRHGRQVRPTAPVLLIGADNWWEANALDRAMRIAGWSFIAADDIVRGRWLASVRRVSLIVVSGDHEFRWRAVSSFVERTDVPVVILTDDPDEVVELVKAGVDAACPASEASRTILARLASVFRGADKREGAAVRYLRAGPLRVDLWTRSCLLDGRPLLLTQTEYDLLTFLMSRPAVTIAASDIVRRVWPHPPADGINALRIAMSRLRRKLGDAPESGSRFIASVRGSGYCFVANVLEEADSSVSRLADTTPLLREVADYANELLVAPADFTLADAAGSLAAAIDRSEVADAVAVIEQRTDHARVLASRRVDERWFGQLCAHASSGDPPRGDDVRTVVDARFGPAAGATARSRDRGERRQPAGPAAAIRTCHMFPIGRDDGRWGEAVLLTDHHTRLDALTIAHVQSLCAVFALRATTLVDQPSFTPADRSPRDPDRRRWPLDP